MITVQNNKQLIHDFYEDVLNTRDWNLLEHFISHDFENSVGQKGINGFIAPVKSFLDAFPDAEWKIQRIAAEDNTTTVWWIVEGTHAKPFQSFPPANKKISVEGMGVFEFKNGKIINAKVLTDRLALLQQINVIPGELSLLNKKENEKTINFIDKFFVPAIAVRSFEERMKINRDFIKTLPGFINDEVYRQFDGNRNLRSITIAKWESEEALSKAKEAVQAEYKKQNFDPAKMFEELGIMLDRAIYKKELITISI